ELSEEEISDLVATKAPLVRLRGRWVSVDVERLRNGLEFLRRANARRDTGAPTAAELLAPAQRHPDDQGPEAPPLPVTDIRAYGWIGELRAGTAERSITPIEPPEGFRAQRRPYRQRGVSWLAFLSARGLGACLADDMGLGQTAQLLAPEAHARARAPPGQRRPTPLTRPKSPLG